MILSLPLLVGAASPNPDAVACNATDRSAVRVHMLDFADRKGVVRVRVFSGPTWSYFDKGRALRRIEHPVPAHGSAIICVGVPGPGIYAADVRHDVNGNGKTGRSDGGGGVRQTARVADGRAVLAQARSEDRPVHGREGGC